MGFFARRERRATRRRVEPLQLLRRLRSRIGAAVGLRRPLIVGAMVGAAVGARQDGEDLGTPIKARESSTAKGKARFFAVLRGSPALFCGVELIEWTTIEVCVMVDDRRVWA